MTPIVDGLEQTYHGHLVFKRIDANEGDGPAVPIPQRPPELAARVRGTADAN